jgi:hypothetical protein
MRLTTTFISATVVCARIVGCVLIGVLASTSPLCAATFTLTDNNSSATITTNSPANTSAWIVDGVDHLTQQSFFYRIGNTAESSLHSLVIGAEGATDTDLDGNTEFLFVGYNGTGFNAEVRYSLVGGTNGSLTSNLGEQISIISTSATPLDFHFFQYVDFDINATPGDDSAHFADAHAVLQYDPSLSVAETADVPQPHHRQIAPYNVILQELTDGGPDTLTDTPAIAAVAGPADLTWAFQWDFTLAPFGTYVISKHKVLTGVPEPMGVTLLGIGCVMLLGIRRKR